MSSSWRFDARIAAVAVAVAVAVAATPSPAYAEDDPIVLTEGASTRVTLANGDAEVEVGIAFKLGDETALRLYGRTPFRDEKKKVATFDPGSSDWKIGLGLETGGDATGETGPMKFWVLSLAVEGNVRRFAYHPGGADAEESETHPSIGAKLGFLWGHGQGQEGGFQAYPQLQLGYDRSWRGADKVGVVIKGSDPEIVKDMVIAPPAVAPVVTARIGLPFTNGSRLAFAPFLSYTVTGDADAWFSLDATQRLRFEAWTYYFPASPAQSRAGIALFVDRRTKGDDLAAETDYGLMLQLRYNLTLFQY